MKNYLFMLFVLVSTNVFAQVGEKNFIDQNYIDVTGKAERKVSPDEIYLQIVINEKDNRGRTSLENQEREMLKTLKAMGIDVEKNLKVSDQVSNFQDYFLRKNTISTSKQYQLMVNSGQKVGQVFIDLEKIGISNINVERVDHSNIEKIKGEVKVEAIKAAKQKATDLANGIGQNIGRAIFVRENENFYPRAMGNMVMKSVANVAYDNAETAPDLEFEKITIEYSVQVFFELK